MTGEKVEKGMTRRRFFGNLAAGAGATGLASTGLWGGASKVVHASSKTPIPKRVKPIAPVNPPKKWEEKADVVVVGGGGSGLCAALRAREKGASSVIVIEAMPSMGGASKEATVLINWGSKAQKRAGIEFNKDDILKQGIQRSNYTVNPALLRTLIHKGSETVDWMEDMGIEWEVESWDEVPCGLVPKGVTEHISWLRAQKFVTDFLLKKGREKGVKFMVKTSAVALVKEGDRIVGVKADKEGEPFFLMGRKAVILAAGGMSVNREMLKKYIPMAYRGCASCYDLPSSNGEVIRMGFGAGADLAGINSVSVFDGGLPYYDEGKGPFYRYLYNGDIQLARQPWLYVNKCCERFMNEDPPSPGYITMAAAQIAQPGGRAYVIFDSKYEKNIWTFKSKYCERPLTPDLPGMDKWPERICPKDWRVAVEKAIKLGLIKVDPTIEGLARKLGLDSARLKKRVEIYNKFCKEGKDPEFGKQPNYLLPVQTPPFYGIAVGAQLAATECGLRINPDCQVMDKECEIIPGLYAAFHTAGGAVGENIAAASLLGDCNLAYTSGYIAGENAALKA